MKKKIDELVQWWKEVVCFWRGHPMGTLNGTFDTQAFRRAIMESSCQRCGKSYVDMYNSGDVRL